LPSSPHCPPITIVAGITSSFLARGACVRRGMASSLAIQLVAQRLHLALQRNHLSA
jgi:hypothetical protein